MSRGLIFAIGIAMATAFGAGAIGAQAPEASRAFDVVVVGEGPPVLLIPGLSTTGEVWEGTVEHLKDRYQLHVLTLAGFGGPAPLGEPFLPTVADALVDYARARQLEKPVIVGHSLGGFLAFAAASRAPGLFGGVVALDGVPFLSALGNPSATPDGLAPQAAQIKAMYATFSAEQLMAQSRLALAGMITDAADVERAAGWAAKSDAAAVGIAVAEMMTTDLRDASKRIDAPVLLMGALGAAPDAMREAFRAAYRAQVAGVPHATVVFAERAKHFVMLDDPAFVFATIDQFLASVASGAPVVPGGPDDAPEGAAWIR
jgi:pimeloyl-ACP methyl ester carboxylesterase